MCLHQPPPIVRTTTGRSGYTICAGVEMDIVR